MINGKILAALIGAGWLSLSAAGCQSCDEGGQGEAARRPGAALRGLSEAGQMQVSSEDRCPVCAMTIAEHPRFSCAIELDDRETFYFCGTGCLIKSWLHPEVYLGRPRDQLAKAVVKEYFEGRQIDGEEAFFVAGSDVVGPMGKALVPLASEPDVETFKQRHGGKAVFKLREMSDERWREITGKQVLPQKGREAL